MGGRRRRDLRPYAAAGTSRSPAADACGIRRRSGRVVGNSLHADTLGPLRTRESIRRGRWRRGTAVPGRRVVRGRAGPGRAGPTGHGRRVHPARDLPRTVARRRRAPSMLPRLRRRRSGCPARWFSSRKRSHRSCRRARSQPWVAASSVRIGDARLPGAAGGGARRGRAASARSRRRGWPARCGGSPGGSPTRSTRPGRAAVADLVEALAAGARPEPAVARLLGRGPGLTPTGDDVLAGALVTLAALGSPAAAPLGRGGAAPRHRTPPRRSRPALLRHAARGECIPQLADLLDAVGDGGADPAAGALPARRARCSRSGTAPAPVCCTGCWSAVAIAHARLAQRRAAGSRRRPGLDRRQRREASRGPARALPGLGRADADQRGADRAARRASGHWSPWRHRSTSTCWPRWASSRRPAAGPNDLVVALVDRRRRGAGGGAGPAGARSCTGPASRPAGIRLVGRAVAAPHHRPRPRARCGAGAGAGLHARPVRLRRGDGRARRRPVGDGLLRQRAGGAGGAAQAGTRPSADCS